MLTVILQVNGNEPYAQSLVNSFSESPPYRNPFSRAVYKSKVSPGVGVWTTRETKFGSVKTLLDVLVQCRFKFSKKLAYVDNSAYLPHARRTEVEEHVEELQVRFPL